VDSTVTWQKGRRNKGPGKNRLLPRLAVIADALRAEGKKHSGGFGAEGLEAPGTPSASAWNKRGKAQKKKKIKGGRSGQGSELVMVTSCIGRKRTRQSRIAACLLQKPLERAPSAGGKGQKYEGEDYEIERPSLRSL